MQDGQARGHDTQGRPLDDWALFSGGNQLTYPVVDDLDGDGTLELVSVEDIAVALPDPGLNDTGDESDLIQREGRLVIRYAGTGSAEGPWPRYRVDAARSGRVAAPTGAVPEPAGGAVLSETFVMPNPAVAQETAGFHYRINSGVSRVMIEIFTARGVPVRTLDGTVDAGVNNVVRWDLTNEQGNGVAPGLYVARVQAEDGSRVDVQTINFVVVR